MALTENLYVGDGSTVLYSFTFPYIDEADVKVSLNQLNTTAFTLSNATTVEFNTAPGTGVSIRIYRETPIDTISSVFFPGSAIRAQDLNNNFEQALYVVQESQVILENSDAATVVGIANQALATANQASSTANAISGTANTALTTANSANTTSNQALTDATSANATAVAARVVADAALNPGSVISDLSNVSSTTPTSTQVLAWSGSEWSPVDQSGGGGDDTIYGAAAAWGRFDVDGTLTGGLNCSVTKVSSGIFTVTFLTPLPDANYSITLGNKGSTDALGGRLATYSQVTATGFQLVTSTTADGSLYPVDDVSFTVFATNALPPMGGTGTDCWGSCQSDGTIDASFNVASVTKTGTGQYDVVFTTPMPTATYSVTTTVAQRTYGVVSAINKTTAGFAINTVYNNGGSVVSSDYAFDFTVNATNATLPSTFTIEQFNDLVARVTALENA